MLINYIMKDTNSIKTWAIDDMPREKLTNKGAFSLSNSELIAILLRSGTSDISAVGLAKLVLTEHNNDLYSLSRKSVKELCQYKGVGPAKAVTLKACFELAKRYREIEDVKKEEKITCSQDAFNVLFPYLNGLNHEEFWCIFLSRSNKIIGVENISKGGIHASIVDLKVVFKKALLHECCGLIIAHNHPSGSKKVSAEDKLTTHKIKQGAEHLDIQLLDHLIFFKNEYLSFADKGLL